MKIKKSRLLVLLLSVAMLLTMLPTAAFAEVVTYTNATQTEVQAQEAQTETQAQEIQTETQTKETQTEAQTQETQTEAQTQETQTEAQTQETQTEAQTQETQTETEAQEAQTEAQNRITSEATSQEESDALLAEGLIDQYKCRIDKNIQGGTLSISSRKSFARGMAETTYPAGTTECPSDPGDIIKVTITPNEGYVLTYIYATYGDTEEEITTSEWWGEDTYTLEGVNTHMTVRAEFIRLDDCVCKANIFGTSTTYYTSVSKAAQKMKRSGASTKATFTMIRDTTEEQFIEFYKGTEVILDLDGYAINCTSGPVIETCAQLEIKDSNSKNQTHNFKVGEDGLWTLTSETQGAVAYEDLTGRPEAGTIVTVTGGCITGGATIATGDSGGNTLGGGINNGTNRSIATNVLTLTGGNIIGNKVTASSGNPAVGGGVFNKGTFIMNGGIIAGNLVCGSTGSGLDNSGGGVHNDDKGVFTLNGGSISYNTSTGDDAGCQGFGGGVNTNSTFTMSGATISYNTADRGGGIFTEGTASSITGGTLTGNVAQVGSGVEADAGLTLGGNVTITGHTNTSGNADNVFLFGDDALITIQDGYTGICGVRRYENDGLGVISTKTDEKYLCNFTSDNNNYGIRFNADSQLEISDSFVVDIQTVPGGTVTANKTEAASAALIVLSATPDEGYVLEGYEIVRKDTGEVYKRTSQFFMPKSDVSVTATFAKVQDITNNKPDHGSVTINGSSEATVTAKVGSKVTLKATADDGYALKDYRVYKTDEPGTTVTVTDASFTMPDYAVTVTADFNRMYTVTIGELTGKGSVSADKKSAEQGETVTLTVTPKEGYNISWVKVNDTEIKAVEGTYAFTMPEKDVTVTAAFEGKGDLQIGTSVVGATTKAAAKDLTFTLKLTEESGQEVTEEYGYTTSDSRSGKVKSGDSITLKDGQTATIKDLPADINYEVTETAVPSGFSVTAIQGGSGTIPAKQTAKASFTNDYTTAGSVQIKVTKTLSGRTLQDKQFSFQLLDSKGTEVLRTATCTADGTVTFGEITYGNADAGQTCTYYIREVVPDDAVNADEKKWSEATEQEKDAGGFSLNGYTYDSAKRRVEVTVADNGDGTMTATPAYYDAAGQKAEGVTVANVYNATGTATLSMWKTLKARDLEANEFTFGLYKEDGTTPVTDKQGNAIRAQNAADGTVEFKLSYDKSNIGQTYTYVAKEIVLGTADPTVVYDTTPWTFVVQVSDNGNGTLSFTQTVKDKDGNEGVVPVVKNTLNPGLLSITNKLESGDASQEFKFMVKFTSPTGDKLDGDYTLTHEEVKVSNPLAAPLASATSFDRLANTSSAYSSSQGQSDAQLDAQASESDTDVTAAAKSGAAAPALSSAAASVKTNTAISAENDASLAGNDNIWTGQCGNCYCVLDSSYCLTISPMSGTDGKLASHTSASDWEWRQSEVPYDLIERVVFENGVKAGTGLVGMFNSFKALESVEGLSNLDTADVKDMSYMFYNCSTVGTLDVSMLDTSNVTDMSNMFGECSKLTSLKLNSDTSTKFSTAKVTTMASMFYNCSTVGTLDVSGFNTANVTTMANMFYNCSTVGTLDVSGFNTANVTTMANMFNGCSKVGTLKLSGFNTANVKSMLCMFQNCSALTTLDLSGFNTANVTTMKKMFNGCTSLTTLNISSFTIKITSKSNMQDMFGADTTNSGITPCAALKEVKLGENFSFKVKGSVATKLPTPTGTSPEGASYTGKWKWNGTGKTVDSLTAADLAAAYPNDNTAPVGEWVWEESTSYTVKFDANGGKGSMADMTCEPGVEYTLSPNAFYNLGKKFKEWNTQADGKGTSYADGATIKDIGNSTLYAQWEEEGPGTMTDGKMEVTLRGNECLTINGVPAGTQYQVYEETPSGWVLVSQSGTSGVIGSLTTAAASFTNKYDTTTTQATIVGTVTVDGSAGKVDADKYSFKLEGAGSTVLEAQTVTCGAGGSIAFSPLTYSTAGTYTYTVSQVIPSETGYIEYDSHTENVTVTVTNDSGNLSATVAYDESGVVFNNQDKTPTPQGTLQITNTVEGTSATDKEFTFTVETILGGVSGQTMTVKAKAGQTVEVGTFDAGTSYTITETTIPAGYTLKSQDNAKGTIVADTTSTALFTNTYAATGSATLNASKILTDGTLTAGRFSFVLKESDTKLQTVACAADGSVTFQPITYTAAGTHTYTIIEEVPDDATNADGVKWSEASKEQKAAGGFAKNNVEYDSHTETVTVKASDNGEGVITTTVTYDESEAKFTNVTIYSVTAAACSNGTVSADKTRAAKGETITVTATPASGFGVSRVYYNDGTQHEITPDTGGSYTFTMPEKAVTVSAVFVHAHDWSYSLSDDNKTITAKCNVTGCDYTGTDTSLTIQAPSNLSYNRESHDASFGEAKTFLGGSLPEISYKYKASESGEYTETSDTKAAGYYMASFTAGTGAGARTAYVEYTISGKQLTVTGTTADGKTYDGTTNATAHIGEIGGVISGDTVKVEIDSANFASKNVRNGLGVTVIYKLTGSDSGNYIEPENSITSADISAKQLTISTEEGKKTTVSDKTYDGTTSATAYIGTLVGKVGSDDVTVSVASAAFDSGHAGSRTATVEYSMTGTDSANYIVPVSDEITADITAKAISVKADDKQSYVGSELAALTYTGDELCGDDAYTGELKTNANKDVVGDYDITQGSLAVDDENSGKNYAITYTKGTYTVKELETQTLSFEKSSINKTYGDDKFTQAVKGAMTAVTYSSSDEAVAEVDSSTGEVTILKVGTVTIKANAAESAVYSAAEASYTLTADKKQLTISTEEGKKTTVSGKTYDGTTSATAYIGTLVGKVGSDDVTVSVASAAFESGHAGSRTATVAYSMTGKDSANYIVPVSDEITADITAKAISVKADDKQSYVGSELAALTYTGDELCGDDAYTGELKTDADKDVAGSYDITQGSLTVNDGNSGKNYAIAYTKGTYTVTGKKIQNLEFRGVSGGRLTKNYGDDSFTEAVSGNVTEVTYSSSDENIATVDEATGKVTILKAGTTVIKATAIETVEYAEGSAEYTLVVKKIKVAVPQAVTGLTYNGKEQTGVELPHGAVYTLSDNVKTDAGSYTAVAKLNDYEKYAWDNVEYEDADQSIAWSIAQKPVKVTADDKSMNLGENMPEFTATKEGLIGKDTVEYTFRKIDAEAQGIYSIVPQGEAEQGNYAVEYKAGNLTVVKTDAEVKADPKALEKILAKYRSDEAYKDTILDVELRTDGKVEDEDKELIANKVGTDNKLKLQLIDAKLYLYSTKDGVTTKKDIGDENDTLISVTYKFDFTRKTDIQVFRVHTTYVDKDAAGTIGSTATGSTATGSTATGSKAVKVLDELTQTANEAGEYVVFDKDAGTITVYASKYSTFAVAYKEVVYADKTGTGDRNNVALYVLLLGLSIASIIGLAIYRRKGSRS